jgi:hypothetical protein
MSKKQPSSSVQQPRIFLDSKGQRYILYPDGQMRRLSQEGTPLPRIKISKKKRIKLRQEYSQIKNLESTELPDKILDTPVINPTNSDVGDQNVQNA